MIKTLFGEKIMEVIDLTHTISAGMPVYPGTEGPRFEVGNTYEKDGFKETLVSMFTHTGTHMDPPAHLYNGAPTLDSLPPEQFVGKAYVADCSELGAGDIITMDYIDCKKADSADFILFYTGWSKYWGKEEYFGNYPVVNSEVIDYIRKSEKKGIGLDTIGLDPISDVNLTLHKKLLSQNSVVIIENLKNLDKLLNCEFIFCALPIKLENADGSPIRAIAIINEGEKVK